ncbi:MAG: energy transducer TonB [Akkermansiaceae bacterium]|jgi:protein TonB|tara:strand:- start:8838 stop:9542 length:705 start_codon:yes stop_codon:yes gene_type:complete
MKLKSIILGIAVTTVLLGVLVATRMMVLTNASAEFEIREIETVSLPEPPLPPPEEPEDEELPPPPPPALADLAMTPDVSQPALPVVKMQVNPRLAVDTFFTDQPPAPLPVVSKPKPRPVVKPTIRKPVSPTIKQAPPKPKSQYSMGELDKKPRLLRNPSVTFPRSIGNATSGRVVVRVTILPSGKSQFLSVSSSTHSALIPLAKRIANGSRFTPPTRHGKPVKAVMTWPIIIKK